ncbi:helix-turn-helix domain-containing protein [Vibrio sp. VB16]|uniref:helix-turn-helix domain-containing protein n=1 Tax=Vibrio sp. VB16 TaxID=2785746 RepID=UPI00189C7170|nr:helix-turn-helix transcriptional regulator [Vibrio sp. VB16]UGA55306.1 helix-turn-helix domain-containing protein [Vibrio sp. VB16]
MELGQKIKQMRISEGLTQKNFAEIVGIPLISLKNYELSRRSSINSTNLLKITTHFQFQKYTLWLMTENFDTSKAEQIAPPAIDGIEEY